MKKIILVLLCLYSLFFIIGSIASPIFAKIGYYNISGKLFFLFFGSCHQQPHLSFWIFGYPVALCCRCLGVYTGTALSSILFLLTDIKINIKLYLILLLLCIIDLSFNYLLNINTGKIIRFFIGSIMGTLIITSINFGCNKLTKRRRVNE